MSSFTNCFQLFPRSSSTSLSSRRIVLAFSVFLQGQFSVLFLLSLCLRFLIISVVNLFFYCLVLCSHLVRKQTRYQNSKFWFKYFLPFISSYHNLEHQTINHNRHKNHQKMKNHSFNSFLKGLRNSFIKMAETFKKLNAQSSRILAPDCSLFVVKSRMKFNCCSLTDGVKCLRFVLRVAV